MDFNISYIYLNDRVGVIQHSTPICVVIFVSTVLGGTSFYRPCRDVIYRPGRDVIYRPCRDVISRTAVYWTIVLLPYFLFTGIFYFCRTYNPFTECPMS